MSKTYDLSGDVFLVGEELEDVLLELDGPRLVLDAPLPPLQTRDIVRDAVRKPAHYTSHPSGIEAIEVTQHMNFCMGNAIKYIWRADYKGDPVTDLRKAMEYLQIEIDRRMLEAAARGAP